jgi:hypothetical protein
VRAAVAEQHHEAVGGVPIVVDHEHPVRHAIGGRDRRRCRPLDSIHDGQPYDELGALTVGVACLDAAAVEHHQVADERQADAEPARARRVARHTLHEEIEDGIDESRIDAGSGIAHRYDRVAILAAGAHPDVTARGRVARCVVEQVREDLRETDGVGLDEERLVAQVDVESMTSALDRRARGFDGVAQRRAEVEGRAPELDLATRYPRDLHQVVDEPDHVTELPFHHVVQPARGAGVRRLRAEDADRVADRREGVSELVREHREEFVLPPVRIAQRRLGGEPRELGAITIDGERGRRREDLDRAALVLGRLTPLAEIRAERAEHAAVVRLDRHAPRRHESEAERQMLELRPARIGGEVPRDDDPAGRGRGGTGAHLRVRLQPIDRAEVVRRQARRCPVAEEAVLVEEEDRRDGAALRQVLDDPGQMREDVGQRLALEHHLERALLRAEQRRHVCGRVMARRRRVGNGAGHRAQYRRMPGRG